MQDKHNIRPIVHEYTFYLQKRDTYILEYEIITFSINRYSLICFYNDILCQRKAKAVVVNNSTNINKMNDHLSPKDSFNSDG